MSLEEDLDRAWRSLGEGEIEEARRLSRLLESQDPQSPDVLLLLAACAREDRDAERALEFLSRATEADPEWATPALWKAELLAADGERASEALELASLAAELAEEPDEVLEALALKATLELELGKLAAARRTLAEVPSPDLAAAPFEVSLELAHLHLAVGLPEEARQRFSALTTREPKLAEAWYGLGLAAEAAGDQPGARQAWLETLALDAAEPLEEPLLDETSMVEVAEGALGELPERARELIRGVPIVIADLPARADVERGLDPRLLGLFEGASYPESGVGGVPVLTQILLFRKNLERAAEDVDELRAEIRTTLLHETGHFFGMSEEDLAELGLD